MKTPEEKAKRAAYMREWNRKNPEKAKASSLKNWDHNGDKYAANARLRRIASPELTAKARTRARAWQLANPERYKANLERSYILNREKRRENDKAWRIANPERTKANKLEAEHRRRAKIQSLPADPKTKAFILAAKFMDSYTCCLCNEPKTGEPWIEHLMPISRGGPHVLANLGYSCPECNLEKSDKTMDEWAAYKLRRAAILSEISLKKLTTPLAAA